MFFIRLSDSHTYILFFKHFPLDVPSKMFSVSSSPYALTAVQFKFEFKAFFFLQGTCSTTATQKSSPEEVASGECRGGFLSDLYLRRYLLHSELTVDGFLCRYLIQELHEAVSGRCSNLFRPADQRGKWRLQPGVSFLLFTTHTPCEFIMLPVYLTSSK